MPFDESLESQLASRARAGESAAFDQLVRLRDREVLELACRLLDDRAEAEDVRQLAWVRVWRGLPDFDQRARFTTWLFRIVVNLCRDRRRERARREARVALGLDGALASAGLEPAEELARDELAARVRGALAALPPDERECLVLRHFHGLATARIGAVVERPRTTVQSCLARALTRLELRLRPLLADERRDPTGATRADSGNDHDPGNRARLP